MDIQQIRKEPSVHTFTKCIIEVALILDPVDAINDILLALDTLTEYFKKEYPEVFTTAPPSNPANKPH
jgi:hypothetical protein